jgi:hypothetical protein
MLNAKRSAGLIVFGAAVDLRDWLGGYDAMGIGHRRRVL